jgi:ribonuclease BN (tRNA processing enzyme)
MKPPEPPMRKLPNPLPTGHRTKGSLTCFGVGDGRSCPDRNHAAFLYRLGATSLLVDCGEPVDRNFTASGSGPETLDGIVLSHLHADHVGGLFMLLQGLWLRGRRRALPVILPGDAIRPLRQMLRAMYLFDELLKFRLRFTAWQAGRPVMIRNVRVTPFRTTHLDNLRARFQKKYRGDFAACCLLLEYGDTRIGHSADLGRPEDLEPLLQQPLDLLVCELAHFSPAQIFRYLRGRRIGQIVFVHLGREPWENLARTRRLAKKMLPHLRHRFATDGEVIRI